MVSKKNYLISIPIPIHRTNMGKTYLTELLESINNQSYKKFEVVISDSSYDSFVKDVASKYKNKFEINYLNSNFKTLPTNANNAINYCNGEIIKPMFSDDIFIQNNSLETINDIFNAVENNWILVSSYDFKNKKDKKIIPLNGRVPTWNNKLLFGNNTIGAPSVLAYKKEIDEKFDKNLRYLIDCDLYFILKNKYGDPFYSNEYLIGVRHHDEQETEMISKFEILIEKFYLFFKHKMRIKK